MPQSWDMGRIIWLPLRRKACWGFLYTEESNVFGRVWTRELGNHRPACEPLDHRSRQKVNKSDKVLSSFCKIFIFYRNITNRDDLRCNYICSLVLRQTLADCDAVASGRCQGIITENANDWEKWKYELLGTSKKFRKSTVSFASHVRVPVNSYETTRPPLEVFKMRWCVKSVEKIRAGK
jgi:hypothetical protein